MFQYILMGVIALALIAGAIFLIKNQLDTKDEIIAAKELEVKGLQATVAARLIDINSLTLVNESCVLENKRIKSDLTESINQRRRIEQRDTIIRNEQNETGDKVKKLKLTDPDTILRLNRYQECINRDLGDTSCAKLLQ